MKFDEYRQQDAVGLAALVARGEVSASELLACAMQRAADVNPDLNAIVIPMHEIAQNRAATTLAGPLAGVPFLIKDIAQDYAGVPTTSGSRALRNYVPPTH
ncbi:MAG: amidase, partial [Moraxellaceae bacterium]|nr:amidase [Moraxellaceae bacterium]MBP9046513.1 amidase [Moraxellaceae bacterium]